jgi:serine/threonine-protein kinase
LNELAGQNLGGYYLEEEVGHGSMGVVYRGKQLALGREVAVKVLPQALARDSSYVARFIREAKIIAGLNHPNIVHIYDAGQQHTLLYFVMEFVQGPTLANLIYLDGIIPQYLAVEYAAQIADALDAAYKERNVIHRDIKPENLMLDRWGKVKVMDFGLARAPGHQAITVAKTLVGSIYYASPEQVWGHTLDNRSDIYALGVVLYEMVSGRRPFTGRSMPELTRAIVNGTLQPPSTFNAEILPELEHIIVTALSRDRRLRYGDASMLAEQLRALALKAPAQPTAQLAPPADQSQYRHQSVVVHLPKRPRAQRPRYLDIEYESTQPLSPAPSAPSANHSRPTDQPSHSPQNGGTSKEQHFSLDGPTHPLLTAQPSTKSETLQIKDGQGQDQQSTQSRRQVQDQKQHKIWHQLQRLFKPSAR